MDDNMNNNQNQPQYQYQPQPRVVYDDPNTRPMTLKDWLLTLLVQIIPCINIIMLFVWAFGNGNVNRKRYCQASLIFMAIMMVVSIIITILSYAAIFGLIEQLSEISNTGL